MLRPTFAEALEMRSASADMPDGVAVENTTFLIGMDPALDPATRATPAGW